MIRSIGDLLQDLLEREKKVLEKQPKLNHAPMLGDMYEGLAKHILEEALLDGLDLRVVEGKAKNANGDLSGQLDCMIVQGQGEQLPYTNHFIYEFPKIIAILEVKKTLYGPDLSDSFLHLRSAKDVKYVPDKRKIPLVRDAWRTLMRRELPTGEEIKALSPEEDMIRCMLTLEAHEPLRVVLGYGGYTSEFELRKGLIGFLEKQIALAGSGPTAGFGIQSFPSQIICGDACLIKTNGMPFGTPLTATGFWQFFASDSKRPLHLFLELLWTRLSYTFSLSPTIFGEDLEIEAFNPLLDAKWHTSGWEYRYSELTEETLKSGPDSIAWEPAVVSMPEYVVVQMLCHGFKVLSGDVKLQESLKADGASFDQVAESLNKKHIAYKNGEELFLLTDGCACATLPDGRYVVGENKTGRLQRWVAEYMRKRRAGGT